MPIAPSAIWKVKNIVAESISGSISEDVRHYNITIDSLQDRGSFFNVRGTYSVVKLYSDSISGNYDARITKNGEISFLSLNGKIIIS